MFRKRFLVSSACVIILALSVTACGSDDKKSEKSDQKPPTGASQSDSGSKSGSGSSDTPFANAVAAACDSVDKSFIDEIANSDIQSDGYGPFQEAVRAGEDELDKVIAKFEDIDPPSKFEDDWDTFLDDFSAIRDAYPQLAAAVQRLSELTEEIRSSDPAVVENARDELLDIQSEMEALTEDLTQRTEEITDIANRIGIKDACDLDS